MVLLPWYHDYNHSQLREFRSRNFNRGDEKRGVSWRYRKQLVQRRENRSWKVGRLPFIAASLRNAPYGHSFTVLRGCCYVFTASFRVHAKETTIPRCGVRWNVGSTSKKNEREIIPRAVNFRRNIFLKRYLLHLMYLESEIEIGKNF